jgi:RNA polymerase sigma factor (sigma-70 family)
MTEVEAGASAEAEEAPHGGLEQLAARAIAGDRPARAQLVAESLPLLRRLARRYRGRGVEDEDLEHDAVVGLLRALERFDPSRGTPFWAYARWWVRQSLQQALAESGRSVRLPTHVLWDMHELKEQRERLSVLLGRDPPIVELADALGWSTGRVEQTLRAEAPSRSLDAPSGETLATADLLEDPLAGDAYERVLGDIAVAQIRPLLLRLSEREREILALRADGESLRQIGRRLGISGQRAAAIEARALAKIRQSVYAGVDTQRRALTSPGAGAVPAVPPPTPDEEER